MLDFLIGLGVGTLLGVATMCIVIAGDTDDKK